MSDVTVIPDYLYCDAIEVGIDENETNLIVLAIVGGNYKTGEIVIDDVGAGKLRRALEKLERKIKEKQNGN